jgi:hypothetical protein
MRLFCCRASQHAAERRSSLHGEVQQRLPSTVHMETLPRHRFDNIATVFSKEVLARNRQQLHNHTLIPIVFAEGRPWRKF